MHILSTILLFLGVFFADDKNTSSIHLECPPDVWLNCGAEIWDLSSYGTAHYYVNGHSYSAGQPEVEYDLTTCQTGKIYRTWKVEDYNWNIISCTQTIYIRGGHFNYHNIQWPKTDLQLYGCSVSTHPDQLPYEYSRPHFDYMTCSMVGSSFRDQVFTFGPGCKKILRKWTVLDWCNYYPGNNNPGYWTYTQTIKVSSTEQPVLSCAKTIEVIPDNCNGKYVQLEDIVADGQACYGNYEVTNDSPYADKNKANASGFYPVGRTTINYKVEYACGQDLWCSQDIIVKEKRPVPYCLSSINVALMPIDNDQDGTPEDGMVEIWAKDLDYGSFHPCYQNEELRFSFSENLDSTFVVFSCENVGENNMQLWVTDRKGNQSWCSVTINVQNNAANIPNCKPQEQNLRGVVQNSLNEPLESVYIDVKSRAYLTDEIVYDTIITEEIIDSFITTGGLIVYMYDFTEELVPRETTRVVPGEVFNIMSDENGYFSSPTLDPFRTYNVNAFKFGDNSTIDEGDIEILKNYIDGEEEFSDPLSYIAADINEDKHINGEDLSLLEQIFRGEEDEWPNERQWVFFDGASLQGMDENINPLQYSLKESIVVDNSIGRFEDKSFIGVLKGDLGRYEKALKQSIIEKRSRTDEKDLVFYPNPFAELLHLDNPSQQELAIRLYSIDGRLVYNGRDNARVIKINLPENFKDGTYLYVLTTSDDSYSGKITKY